MKTFKKKFAWLPTEIYSSVYMRDGFAWFTFVYERDGRCYRSRLAMINSQDDGHTWI